MLEPRRHLMRSVVVETHAVDDAPVLRQSKQARPGVSWLLEQGHAAHFHKAKAEGGPRGKRQRVFIESCGQTHRIRELETPQFDLETRVSWGAKVCDTLERSRMVRRGFKRVHHSFVNRFGVELEEEFFQ